MTTGRAASLVAQAKINLVLRILAREDSGYHQIETIFCRLTLGDRVRVEPTAGAWELELSGPALPASGLGDPQTNLAWRAAAAYQHAAGWPAGARITVEKHIPVGGGLGGGSADAGAVLRLLDALAPTPLGAPRLLTLAAALGADVPFLTQARTPLALGYGRGDRLVELAALPSRPCSLVAAPFGVSTAEAYRKLAAARHGTARPEGALINVSELSDWDVVARLSINEFEPVVLAMHPPLNQAFIALVLATPNSALVRMSGSGGTLYVIGNSPGHSVVLPPGFTVMGTRTATEVERISVE